MKKNTIVTLIVLVLIAAGIAYAVHMKSMESSPSVVPVTETPEMVPTGTLGPRNAKVAPSAMADGSYEVHFVSVASNPEDSVATVSLVDGGQTFTVPLSPSVKAIATDSVSTYGITIKDGMLASIIKK